MSMVVVKQHGFLTKQLCVAFPTMSRSLCGEGLRASQPALLVVRFGLYCVLVAFCLRCVVWCVTGDMADIGGQQ